MSLRETIRLLIVVKSDAFHPASGSIGDRPLIDERPRAIPEHLSEHPSSLPSAS
jgi:hypothetical protein